MSRRGLGSGTAVALLLFAAGAAVDSGAAEARGAKFGKRVLKRGSVGKDVRVLQRGLTRLKLPTPATGRFGPQTRANVRLLEDRQRWKVDGVVQRRQAKRIEKLVATQIARKRARQLSSAGYVFPVADPHDFGGPQARFGAGRSGHSHQGQDVFAPCGTPLRAAHPGVVKGRSYQRAAGHFLVIDGVDGTDTVYMHMNKASWAVVGTALYPGQQIGRVGDSGNASGCHLHFEHWTSPGWYSGGFPVDPLPGLLAWDQYS